MSKGKMCRVASRDMLCERLSKRVRFSTVPPRSTSTVIKDSLLSKNTPFNSNECCELLDLLLLKAGFDIVEGEDDALPLEIKVIEALKKEYSPRAAELLVKMVTGGGDLSDIVSDISSNASDEDEIAQRVPAVPPIADAVVPHTIATVPPVSMEEVVTPAVEYNQETEIALSRIFQIGKSATVADPSISPEVAYHGPSVITMTGFGKLGRFGNQVLQYMFLKCYAKVNAVSEIQVPNWIGGDLFGLRDREVQRALPAVIEFRGTKANSTFTTEFIKYIEASNGGRPPQEIGLDVLSGKDRSKGPVNVDVWGWFQWHTSKYLPFKRIIQETFEPVESLKRHMDKLFDMKIRHHESTRRTVVGIHVRRGDYKNIAASSFGYCAPTSWYLEWLDKIWDTLDNPLLFITSDELDAVIEDFASYNPVTADMIGFDLPLEFKGRKAGFFPDWYGLTKCDILGISNSTFSFTACMMNKNPGARYFRPHFADRMTEFDPWNAEPIIHRDLKKNTITQTLETLQVVYATQGSRAVLRNILYELPFHAFRSIIIRAVLWREARIRAKQNAVVPISS